tara:strand:+ start:64 stop:555 length:492 start_codon:yes stop_codon:yes gene_type:complete
MGQNHFCITTYMNRLLAFGTIVLTMAACSPDKKIDPSVTSAKPMIKEVFTSSETLNGTTLTYPAGKPELRLYKVKIPAGGKIPLHTHSAPMMVYLQDVRSGSLVNTRVKPDGSEIKTIFNPGEAFVEGANEPHYVENVGEEPTIVWVTVASVQGMPTTEFIDE